MPKQALVLNGFGGGINKDSDATDLPAEGRGKDQVVSLKNMLADRGGKVRTRLYTVAAESSFTGGTTTAGKNGLLIFNNKEYQEQGLYKVGKDVNWNAAIKALTPVSVAHAATRRASIGINPSFSTKNAELIFLGASGSQSESTNAIFGGTEQSSSYAINRYIRPTCDANQQDGIADSPQITDFENFTGLGAYGSTVTNFNLSSSGSTYTLTTSGANAGGAGTPVTKESGGLQIAHGAQHVDGGATAYIEIPVKFWQYSAHKIELTVSGMQSGTNSLPLQIDSAADSSGSVIKSSFVVADNGDETITFTVSASRAATNYLKIGKASPTNFASSANVTITGIRIYSYGQLGSTATTAQDGVRAMLINNSEAHLDTYTGAAYGTDPWDGTVNYDVSGAKKLRLDKPYNNGANVSLFFRTGAHTVGGSTADGMFGTGLNIKNKDIYLELNVDPGSALADVTNFEKLQIIFDSHTVNYETSGDNSYARVYEITKAELDAQQAFRATGRFKITHQSHTYDGGNFTETSVRNIAITAFVATDANGWNHSVLELYEFSISDSTDLGWTEATVQFSESDTRNNSESLTTNYTSTIEADEKNQLDVTIYEPTTSGYKGNLYFQTLDDSDGVSTNSRFLLAQVDAAKGAKKVGATDWTSWDSNEASFSFSNIPRESTFEFESGYPERTEYVNAIWETAATNGRQVYIGNVHSPGFYSSIILVSNSSSNILINGSTGNLQNWEHGGFSEGDIITITGTSDDDGTYQLTGINGVTATLKTEVGGSVTPDTAETITCYFGIKDTDKILKTPIGKLYGFSNKNFIDLELGAGNIKVLKTSGDRLLVFSEDTLTIVNVAQDYEYLEATLPGYGVSANTQVVQVEEGVAFVNSSGVFFFDGNKVNNISGSLIDSVGFSSASSIGYEPIEKIILVWKDGNADEVFGYSLKTNSWVGEFDAMGIPRTNSVAYKSNMYFVDTSDDLQKISNGTTARNTELETGRISCGNLAMQKSFKALYITVVSNTNALTVDWAIDNGAYTGSPTTISGNGRIKVTINAKGQDIQFKFAGTSKPVDFEISDIQLIYRDKKVK